MAAAGGGGSRLGRPREAGARGGPTVGHEIRDRATRRRGWPRDNASGAARSGAGRRATAHRQAAGRKQAAFPQRVTGRKVGAAGRQAAASERGSEARQLREARGEARGPRPRRRESSQRESSRREGRVRRGRAVAERRAFLNLLTEGIIDGTLAKGSPLAKGSYKRVKALQCQC